MDDYNDDNENLEEDYQQNESDFKTRRYTFLEGFYQKIKNNSCVLSKEEILTLCNKKGFFNNNIWSQYSYLKTISKDEKHTSSLLFGLKSGIFLIGDKFSFIIGESDNRHSFSITLDELVYKSKSFNGNMIRGEIGSYNRKVCLPEEKEILLELAREWEVELDLERLSIEKNQKNKFKDILKYNSDLISELYSKLNIDTDGNLKLEDFSDLSKILQKNQKKIIEIDKVYVQKFVKIINYLSEKKSNILSIFKSLTELFNDKNEQISSLQSLFDEQDNFNGKEYFKNIMEEELNNRINLLKGLKNQIHTYELLLFHSINMITSLIDDNLIVFYEIYECIDKLGIFNSNWENEVTNRLSNIDENLNELVYSINRMENNIVNSVKKLTYITQESFKDLNFSVNKQLSSIDSSIKFNNLLTLIQTYEVYKINQNTKRLN